MVPWVLVAQDSPLYTDQGLLLVLGLWVLGIAVGIVYAVAGRRSRSIGVGIVWGTLAGLLTWIVVVAALFQAADWD